MQFLRGLLLTAVASCVFIIPNSLSAQCCNEGVSALRQRDFEAVQSYLNSKRTTDVQEKSCNLVISGDVRTIWRHLTERDCGNLRGGSAVGADDFPISRNCFDADFDLYIDYACDRAWGVVWLEFLNRMGVEESGLPCGIDPQGCGGSGTCEELCLRKAYIGYNVCCDGDSRFDIELGRRPLWTVFDSRIQFNDRFDGLLFRYSRGLGCWGLAYVNAGGFVVDERVNHYSYVVEAGWLDIAESGFDFKYSFIHWPKRGVNRCQVKNPRGFQFKNSQWTFAYNLNPCWLYGIPAQIYGAVLYNHDAGRLEEDRKRNLGWYVGFIAGQVRLAGDWSLEVDYEVVQSQAISDCDVSGIGTGNVNNDSFPVNGRGNANYQGWRFEGVYALTDNLIFDTIVEFSHNIDPEFVLQENGTLKKEPHSYSKLEIQAIYAF